MKLTNVRDMFGEKWNTPISELDTSKFQLEFHNVYGNLRLKETHYYHKQIT
jgi:hypothetical protein